MTAELNAEEMELHALKEYGERKEEERLPRRQIDLVARPEVVQRQNRGGRDAADARPEAEAPA
jgi:hypothetical protein